MMKKTKQIFEKNSDFQPSGKTFYRKPEDKNMMTIPPDDSEISDGTPPELADSEARPNRFLQKRNFFLTGKPDFYLSKNGRVKFSIKRLRLLRVKIYETAEENRKHGRGDRTSHNLGLPASGIRRPHPRLINGGRGCGNGWSLCDIARRKYE